MSWFIIELDGVGYSPPRSPGDGFALGRPYLFTKHETEAEVERLVAGGNACTLVIVEMAPKLDSEAESFWTAKVRSAAPLIREWLRPAMLRFVEQAQREGCVPGIVEVDAWLCSLNVPAAPARKEE